MNTTEKEIYEGMIIGEAEAIPGLNDGSIYIAAADKEYIDAAHTAKENLFAMMDISQTIYAYEIQALEGLPSPKKGSKVNEAVLNSANLIMPLATPNMPGKQYLVAQADKTSLDMYLPSLIMRAENITKDAIAAAFMNLAVQDPESFTSLIKDIKPHSGIISESLGTIIGKMVVAPMIGAGAVMPMASAAKGVLASRISYKEARKIYKRFIENCKIIRESEKFEKIPPEMEEQLKTAQVEVDYVISDVFNTKNIICLRRLFINNDDNLIKETYDNFINRDKMAQSSAVSIVIEKAKEGRSVTKPNDGRYRVYAVKGDERLPIHFGRKASCIVYMMYLLDKQKRGDNVDTFKVALNKEMFCRLYTDVYDNIGVETIFNGLTKKIVEEGVRQTRLKDCYNDIKKSFAKIYDTFGEYPNHFVIPNENSHLAILQKNIDIPDSFKNYTFIY